MKNLIAKLFSTSSPANADKAGRSARDNPLTIEDGSDNATRRQLVQVLLRDVMRRHGIPPQWVDCQMQLVSSRSRGPGMYVRLVVRHWDDRLMRYAFAFQNELMTDIGRFEPQASTWLHGMSWQLEVADSCPYPTLPDKAFWQAVAKPALRTGASPPAAAAAAMAAPQADFPSTQPGAGTSDAKTAKPAASPAEEPDNDPLKDLERLFVIRDQEIGRQAAGGHAPVGYESTQPSAL